MSLMEVHEAQDSPRVYVPIGNLASALAKAQSELKNPAKGHTADIRSDKGSFKYKYSTLAEGLDAIRAALSKNELAYVQTTEIRGEMMILYTRLIHSSGEWIGSEWPVAPIGRLTPQQMGSALTYARRYSIFGIVGIAGDDDDDGAAASAPAVQKPPMPPVPPGKRPLPKSWRDDVRKWFNEAPTEDALHTHYEKTLAAFRFDKSDREEIDAMLREAAIGLMPKEEANA